MKPHSVPSMRNCPSARRAKVENAQAPFIAAPAPNTNPPSVESPEIAHPRGTAPADGTSQKTGIVTTRTHSTVLPKLRSMWAVPEPITSAIARTLQMLPPQIPPHPQDHIKAPQPHP